ncbi:tRNA-Thr(GGU) m(6)t(6)A37 methyltransferase TsaA [Alkalispirochaeta americana]|uniref:tRNA-Thr(GGU) m(6)t(6)A37 methyltransferase TsaA n=1 Tax=Alkalispirochaeta americana TaxID=159291 RepID=A0A1N6SWF9_9SPIO|nr:TrmO family methyltransferase [Alkalispirochaeta americana]SIQ45465.1 tRNA-Thr(GGU) m(6)t(6)A37 methyltransferase TsaA [Alkalispirochaeta americana]
MKTKTMKEPVTIRPLGWVEKTGEGAFVQLQEEFREGLQGLDEFSHVIIFWWGQGDNQKVPMTMDLPYAPGVQAGLFATRSPLRPNSVNMTVAGVLAIDCPKGRIKLDELDAFAGTAVIDIKPYYGCLDRVQEYRQPQWVPSEWGEWYYPLPEEIW